MSSAKRPITIDAAFVESCRHAVGRMGFATILWQSSTQYGDLVLQSLGFTLRDRLEVLARQDTLYRDLTERLRAPLTMRRATGADVNEVLEIDAQCFEPFWRLNESAIEDAILATPRSRYRVVVDPRRTPGRGIVAYCIFGQGGGSGFLQRLAVEPLYQNHGIATTLIRDGLVWLHRWRCQEVSVNTQASNAVALQLYRNLDFVLRERGIHLYESSSSL